MKIFTIGTFICLLLAILNANAQELAPLELNNFWVFNYNSNIHRRVTIVDTNYIIDSIIYNKTKWQSNFSTDSGFIFMRLTDSNYYAVRLDTSYPAPNHEKLYYKKNAVLGDTWENPGEFFPMVYTIVDTQRINVFGQMVTVKRMDIDASLLYFIEYWTEEFGVLSRTQQPSPSPLYTLRGCVIDGVAYGDTSFVVTVADDFEPANDFNVEQNYPNPFNPSTTMKYNIPAAGIVKFVVYNSLGEKIRELVNEWQSAGSYNINFTAKDIPSGVYFYVLQYNNNIQTKKMVLLK